MRTHAVFAIAVGLLSAAALPASADPAYKAIDIIQHFAPATPTNLGTGRGLCIGTERECASPATGQATAAKPARPLEGFDLVVTFDHNSDILTKKARENLDEFSKALNDPQLAASAFMTGFSSCARDQRAATRLSFGHRRGGTGRQDGGHLDGRPSLGAAPTYIVP